MDIASPELRREDGSSSSSWACLTEMGADFARASPDDDGTLFGRGLSGEALMGGAAFGSGAEAGTERSAWFAAGGHDDRVLASLAAMCAAI
jgi:hypothetical protein